MMMNHTLQQKGQPATSGEMAFMAHLWYAPVHHSKIVPVQRGLLFCTCETPFGQTVGGGSWV